MEKKMTSAELAAFRLNKGKTKGTMISMAKGGMSC